MKRYIKSNTPNEPNQVKSGLVREIIKRAKEIRDYFQYHNNNLNRKQEQYLDDLSDGIDNQSISAIRNAIENLKYNSKNMRSGQYDLVINLYNDFNFAGGKFEGMGYPEADIDARSKVTASTSFKYADKVEFEDIYPSDRDISFFFTSDDVAYAKELLGNVTGLTGFSIQVSLPKDYNGDWQEALIYISPKTSDGNGGESDSDWTDITFDISDADMQSLVDQSWAEYKKRGWDVSGTKVTSSTKYMANMVNASDDSYEQLAAGDDAESEDYIEYGKYYVAGYLQSSYRGLMEDLYSDDFEEILVNAADMAGQGLYVEITNRADGRSERYTPEDFEEAASNGEYPDHIREDLAL